MALKTKPSVSFGNAATASSSSNTKCNNPTETVVKPLMKSSKEPSAAAAAAKQPIERVAHANPFAVLSAVPARPARPDLLAAVAVPSGGFTANKAMAADDAPAPPFDSNRAADVLRNSSGFKTTAASTTSRVAKSSSNESRAPQAVNNDNFIRRNLKKRGNAGGYTARKRKQAKFDARLASRQTDGASADAYGCDSSSDDDDDDAAAAVRQRREGGGGGLASLGLDPLQLSLDAIAAPPKKTAKPGAAAAPALEVAQQLPRGLAAKRTRAKRGAHATFTDDELAEHAPACSGHAFPAKVP